MVAVKALLFCGDMSSNDRLNCCENTAGFPESEPHHRSAAASVCCDLSLPKVDCRPWRTIVASRGPMRSLHALCKNFSKAAKSTSTETSAAA